MENDKIKILRIKNRTCYYFNDIIKLEEFDLDNILIQEKSYKNILNYDISYKALIDPKPMCIRFDKMDGLNRVYDGIRYIILFRSEKFGAFYDRIRYLLTLKSDTAYIFSRYFVKTIVDSLSF